jgi:peptide/nickel transport system substrate-binding protein
MLSDQVSAGTIPALQDRIPLEPSVVTPVEEIGQYGGTWRRLAVGPGDVGIFPSRIWYNNLLRWNIDGSDSYPHLCTNFEVSDGGKTFTFSLRKGMKWSDGEPYSADDYVAWYEHRLLNEDLTPAFPSWLTTDGEPGKIEKVDDYTVRFAFTGVHGLFMTLIPSANGGGDTVCFPWHYLRQFHPDYADKAALDKMVADEQFQYWYELFGDRNNYNVNTEKPTIGNWVFTVLPPATTAELERNAFYWKADTEGNQLPYIDKITADILENAELLNMRAVAGDLDCQLRHILFGNYPLFQDNKEQGDYRILQWIRGYITDAVIAPNVAHKDPVMREIIGDKRFRWALSLGMNRSEIIESVYLGMAEPNQISPLSTSPHYWEEQAKNMIDYDPDQANSLLDEMGLTDKDADGYRMRPDGQRLTITYEYAPIFGSWGDIGELLSAQWKALGIELQVKEENRDLFYERKAANDHDMGVWTGSAEFNPFIDPRWFLPFSDESVGMTPYAAWYNTDGTEGEEPPPDLRKTQELYDQIKSVADFEQQKALFRQILELDKENMWVLGIATAPPEIVITKNNFRNVPDVAVSDWHLQTLGNTMPEQYFWKE